jgi:Tol biopolymer transport system component
MRRVAHALDAVLTFMIVCNSQPVSAADPLAEPPLGDRAANIFDSDRTGTTEIFIIGSEGLGPTRVTSASPQVFNRLPDWSPDCSMIAFQSNCADEDNRDIYVMTADGSGARRITTHPASDESPAWSPDGSQIAFASDREQGEAVWVIGVDGLDLRRLTFGTGPAFQPSWSPDGRYIAFVSGSESNWDLYVSRADGSEVRNLTNTPDRHEGGTAWSPDGRKILFDGLEDGHWEIYLMAADGSDERQLTRNRAMDARPAWSADGSEIVFHSTRDFGSDGENVDYSQVELYVMGADGSDVRRLTRNEDFDAHPDWCLEIPGP